MKKRMNCKVAIIGAGPAGLACAAELISLGQRDIILIDKGPNLFARQCPALRKGQCTQCRICSLYSGVGGASGLLGGKLCHFPAGSRILDHVGLTSEVANHKVDSFLSHIQGSFSPPRSYELLAPDLTRLTKEATLKQYLSIPLLSTDMHTIFKSMVTFLTLNGVTLLSDTNVIDLENKGGNAEFTLKLAINGSTETLDVYESLVIATGRSGESWLMKLLSPTIVAPTYDFVDVGVRIEVPNNAAEGILPLLQDPKFKIRPGQPDEVRTLCWCRGGEITQGMVNGKMLIDGHFGSVFTKNTSVSIVSRVSANTKFSAFDKAIDHFSSKQSIPIVENLHRFLGLNHSKLHAIIEPKLKYDECHFRKIMDVGLYAKIAEMLFELNDISNGDLLKSNFGSVYGPVIDKFWPTPVLSGELESQIKNLYIAGDATGLGRGIIQSIFSGLYAATSIYCKNSKFYINRDGLIRDSARRVA